MDQFVSVRASEIGSKSSNAASGSNENGSEIKSKQDEFVKEIKTQAKTAEAADWDSFDDDGMVW